jgi:hypothetical protein
VLLLTYLVFIEKKENSNKFKMRNFYLLKIVVPIILFILIFNLIQKRKNSFEFDYWKNERLCDNYEIMRWYHSKKEPDQLLSKQDEYKKKVINFPHSLISEFIHFPGRAEFSSRDKRHIEPLVIASIITDGDILDLAIDVQTTQILRNIVLEQNRFLVSIENDENWLKNFIDWNNTDNHLLLSPKVNSKCVKSIRKTKKWGLLSVDHLNDFREKQIIKYANSTQILFIHNTDREKSVSYERLFKFKCFSKFDFEDGIYSAIYFYTNFKEKFDILEKALDNVVLKDSRYLCGTF